LCCAHTININGTLVLVSVLCLSPVPYARCWLSCSLLTLRLQRPQPHTPTPTRTTGMQTHSAGPSRRRSGGSASSFGVGSSDSDLSANMRAVPTGRVVVGGASRFFNGGGRGRGAGMSIDTGSEALVGWTASDPSPLSLPSPSTPPAALGADLAVDVRTPNNVLASLPPCVVDLTPVVVVVAARLLRWCCWCCWCRVCASSALQIANAVAIQTPSSTRTGRAFSFDPDAVSRRTRTDSESSNTAWGTTAPTAPHAHTHNSHSHTRTPPPAASRDSRRGSVEDRARGASGVSSSSVAGADAGAGVTADRGAPVERPRARGSRSAPQRSRAEPGQADMLGQGYFASDGELVAMLRVKPKSVPALRNRTNFRNFFRGMPKARMVRLLRTAFERMDEAAREAKVSVLFAWHMGVVGAKQCIVLMLTVFAVPPPQVRKRLGLVQGVLSDEPDEQR